MDLTRRVLLIGLAMLSLGAGVAGPAEPSADGVFVGSRRIEPERMAVFALDNENTRYRCWAEWSGELTDARHLLRVGTLELEANSRGSGGGTASASFEMGRTEADVVARALGLKRQDRSRLGAGLVETFRRDGNTVTLTVRNEGAPVGMVIGGRNRGLRNNRFGFQAWRGREPVEEKVAYDHGGLAFTKWLETGDEVELTEQLDRWFDLDGTETVIEARYEAELVVGEAHPVWPEEAHHHWDRVFDGTL